MRRQDLQQLLRLAAGAQGQDDVAVGHHPEIAVKGIRGIEHDRRRAGAGEGGGDLVARYARICRSPRTTTFPRASTASLISSTARGRLGPRRSRKPLEFENFDVENTNRLFKVIHRPVYCGLDDWGGQELAPSSGDDL